MFYVYTMPAGMKLYRPFAPTCCLFGYIWRYEVFEKYSHLWIAYSISRPNQIGHYLIRQVSDIRIPLLAFTTIPLRWISQQEKIKLYLQCSLLCLLSVKPPNTTRSLEQFSLGLNVPSPKKMNMDATMQPLGFHKGFKRLNLLLM